MEACGAGEEVAEGGGAALGSGVSVRVDTEPEGL